MIRGFLSVIVGVLLILSLIVLGISWDISSSLSYHNVEKNAVSTATEFLNSQTSITQQINNSMPLIKQYCDMGHEEISLTYQGYNITISCSDANASASKLINDTLTNMVKNIYYTRYNCGYWSCFSSSPNGIPLFLISEQSHEYWKDMFYYSILSSTLLIAAFVFLSRKRKSSSLPIGIMIIVGALPLLAIQKVTSFLPNTISGLSSLFFSQSKSVFIIMIITGGVLTVAGIIVKIVTGSSKLYNYFHKKESKSSTNQEQKARVKTSEK